jgi:two-component system chemotaxis sensor kinase CheA
VRVNVAVLDALMDLVGELVLTRGRFAAGGVDDDDGPLAAPFRQLRLVTSELQDSVMQARLQPIGTVTGKLHRVVRDLAATTGKQVVLEIEGDDIGVDRAVNEALRDPLLHLVRNAVDHGIETPGDRRAAGKPSTGTLSLRVGHEGGRVKVELRDDGRGVDAGGLVERAVACGLLDVDAAARLERHDALELMFRPGLSTKEQVTTISGRGVGLDVVRAGLQQVGGRIDVTSEPGQGSAFRLDVPLTLAIMSVLLVGVGGQCYAVPQVDVAEVVHIPAGDVDGAVVDLGGPCVLRCRDHLLPLVELSAALGLAPDGIAGDLTVVVVDSGARRFGLVVDAVEDTTEVVVKPLTAATRAVRAFGGVTLLPNGDPALILDIAGLAGGAAITAGPGPTPGPDHDAGRQTAGVPSPQLLVAAVEDGLIGVPMAVVRRLELIHRRSVERSGPIDVARYRGGVLPLLPAPGAPPIRGGPEVAPSEVLHTVVCETSVGLIGLVVGRIDDVVADPSATSPRATHAGAARLVVGDAVIELLDVEAIAAAAGLGAQR